MAETVALFVAFAAFVVSVASLYLTSLRPAEIEVDYVPTAGELEGGGFNGPFPQPTDLVLALVVSNAGAHGGLLQELYLDDFSYAGDEPAYWLGVAQGAPYAQRTTGGIHLPIALEAGDVETLFLHAQLQPAGGYSADDPTPLARQLRGLTSIRLRIRWTVVRTAGLVRRRRETTRQWRAIEIDCSTYRQTVIDLWRAYNEYARYAEIAEGKAEPKSAAGRAE